MTLAKKLSDKFIFIPKRPGEPNSTFANISKIKRNYKWKPKIDINEGISLVLKNIDDWKTAKLWTKNSIAKATVDWFKYLK